MTNIKNNDFSTERLVRARQKNQEEALTQERPMLARRRYEEGERDLAYNQTENLAQAETGSQEGTSS